MQQQKYIFRIILLLLVFTSKDLLAQISGVYYEVDTVFYAPLPDSPDTDGSLTNHATYSIYAQFTNASDVLHTLFAHDTTEPLYIDVPCGCYNTPVVGDLLGNSPPSITQAFPVVAFDTYWTLGDMTSGEELFINELLDPNGSLTYSETNLCEAQVVNGAIYHLYQSCGYSLDACNVHCSIDENCLADCQEYYDICQSELTTQPFAAGEDLTLKIAQVTSACGFSLHACFQVSVEGEQSNTQFWCMDGDGEGPLVVEHACSDYLSENSTITILDSISGVCTYEGLQTISNGGNPPFHYDLFGANGILLDTKIGLTASDTISWMPLQTGEYYVAIKDGNTCRDTTETIFIDPTIVDIDSNGICDTEEVLGCTVESSCNYNPEATFDDGTCIPSGCQNESACNYDPNAQCPGELCDFSCCPGPGCCGDGTFWDAQLGVCQPESPETCSADLNVDGIVGVEDLLQLLVMFGYPCETNDAFAGCGTLLAYHGHNYKTKQIGNQCWFQENLQTPYYANGDSISGEWSPFGGYSNHVGMQTIYGLNGTIIDGGSNDVEENLENFGRLYNWYAVEDARKLCPSGWHVATDNDWKILEIALGMSVSEANAVGWRGTNQGFQLKAAASDSPTWNGSNLVGFSALPGGIAGSQWTYVGQGIHGAWWAPQDEGGVSPITRLLYTGQSQIERGVGALSNNQANSIRCIKDN